MPRRYLRRPERVSSFLRPRIEYPVRDLRWHATSPSQFGTVGRNGRPGGFPLFFSGAARRLTFRAAAPVFVASLLPAATLRRAAEKQKGGLGETPKATNSTALVAHALTGCTG